MSSLQRHMVSGMARIVFRNPFNKADKPQDQQPADAAAPAEKAKQQRYVEFVDGSNVVAVPEADDLAAAAKSAFDTAKALDLGIPGVMLRVVHTNDADSEHNYATLLTSKAAADGEALLGKAQAAVERVLARAGESHEAGREMRMEVLPAVRFELNQHSRQGVKDATEGKAYPKVGAWYKDAEVIVAKGDKHTFVDSFNVSGTPGARDNVAFAPPPVSKAEFAYPAKEAKEAAEPTMG